MIARMHLSHLLEHYGYLAVFVAGLFEGETMLMLGAYAVHQGYLSLWPLIAWGAGAAVVADQFYFRLGRHKGSALLAKRPKLRAHIQRVGGFVERHPVAAVFVMRFAWGLRIVLPAALGMGTMRASVFTALNIPAAVIWATIVSLLRVRVTEYVHASIGHLRPHEHSLILGALAVAGTVALFRLWRTRR